MTFFSSAQIASLTNHEQHVKRTVVDLTHPSMENQQILFTIFKTLDDAKNIFLAENRTFEKEADLVDALITALLSSGLYENYTFLIQLSDLARRLHDSSLINKQNGVKSMMFVIKNNEQKNDKHDPLKPAPQELRANFIGHPNNLSPNDHQAVGHRGQMFKNPNAVFGNQSSYNPIPPLNNKGKDIIDLRHGHIPYAKYMQLFTAIQSVFIIQGQLKNLVMDDKSNLFYNIELAKIVLETGLFSDKCFLLNDVHRGCNLVLASGFLKAAGKNCAEFIFTDQLNFHFSNSNNAQVFATNDTQEHHYDGIANVAMSAVPQVSEDGINISEGLTDKTSFSKNETPTGNKFESDNGNPDEMKVVLYSTALNNPKGFIPDYKLLFQDDIGILTLLAQKRKVVKCTEQESEFVFNDLSKMLFGPNGLKDYNTHIEVLKTGLFKDYLIYVPDTSAGLMLHQASVNLLMTGNDVAMVAILPDVLCATTNIKHTPSNQSSNNFTGQHITGPWR